ncbi:MAG: hypothetical protein ACLRRH_02220 [Clostridium sp.]
MFLFFSSNTLEYDVYSSTKYLSSSPFVTFFILVPKALYYHYNFLHEHSSLNNLTPAMVAGLNYSTKDIKNWMLF